MHHFKNGFASKSPGKYFYTPSSIWSRHKIVEIPSFTPANRRGGRYYQLIWTTTVDFDCNL
ncbi:MAG: hypothetical protein LBR79_02975 [Oscillospiraceae bacterium]|nr:hypothetical protein [Oscillospiraceae bacterium]